MENLALIADRVRYYSKSDEQAFFTWLRSIACVENVIGTGTVLTISLARAPNDDELREIVALFRRYNVNMRQLAAFLTDANRSWFQNTQGYWFQSVFG